MESRLVFSVTAIVLVCCLHVSKWSLSVQRMHLHYGQPPGGTLYSHSATILSGCRIPRLFNTRLQSIIISLRFKLG
jgi:hypothetical protein